MPHPAARRRAVLFAASVAVLSLFFVSRASEAAFAQAAPMTAASYLSRLFLSLTPGLVVAGGASALYARRDSPPKPLWCVAAALLALLTLAIPLWVGAGDLQAAQKPEQAPQQVPRSGEERLMPDGSFVRVADPRPGNGPIEEGWQQALWTEMTEAVSKGEEQVVMVFSRQGCPWCDRLHPVLQNAIKNRAAAIANGAAAEGPPLLNSPLRIFVYDLQEFGPIMQRFQIEGFPTILAFGPPGSRPVMVPGYLSDEDFEKLLTDVAVAKPEPARKGKKKKKLFR